MKKSVFSTTLLSLALLISGFAQAQGIETVYNLKFDSTSAVKAAMTELFEDDDLRGSKATLYVNDFGVPGDGTHTIVGDYDSYAARSKFAKARMESHGWAKYLLATQGTELVSADLVTVIKDYGKPRQTAGYLVAYTMQVGDPGRYVAALDKLHDAIGDPGVLRLVGIRSGPADVTHAVLIGAEDFVAANEYLDKLLTSDAYAAFVNEVDDVRKIHNVAMYRRVGAWGY